jgi:hypothetical protein
MPESERRLVYDPKVAAGPIGVDSGRVLTMLSAGNDEPTMPDEAPAGRLRPGAAPDVILTLIIFTTALALLAAWYVYKGWKHPEHRLPDLLWAVLCLLYAVRLWVHKPIGGRLASKHNSSFRRVLVALFALFVLGLIAFDYAIDSRRQMAAEALAQRKQVWKNSVTRQRETVELAETQVSDASRKWKEAAEAMTKTAVQIKRPDGKVEPGFDPEAFRKWKDAMDESLAAMNRRAAESDRLLRLQLEEPGRFGRP